jgi:tRNA(Ile)-lysidine synthase
LSGGGDSLALLHLLTDWARARRAPLPVALIVDHRLRKGSTADARRAASWAKALGLETILLVRHGAAPSGDVEAAAREARYRLMGDWLAERGMAALYVAHTRDDQAETFLLRLARGSGLDGLSAMQPVARYPVAGYRQLSLVRPLLDFGRAELRAHLTEIGQEWLDDPMNKDPRFARARIRENWPAFERAGLTAARLADAAYHLSRARQALDMATLAVLARVSRIEGGTALVDGKVLGEAPRELGLRALATLLMTIANEPYRPRFASLERLFDSLASGTFAGGATLHGCRLAPAPRRMAIFGQGTILIAPEGRKAAKPRGTPHSSGL